ncbi:MAG: hypothetical protein AAGI51_13525 [Pseudomonadota bacterium]
MRGPLITRVLGALTLAASAALAPGAAAEDGASPWAFEANLYGWSAGFTTKNSAGDKAILDIPDVLENLRMAGMGGLAVRYDRFGAFGDFIYANLANGVNNTTSNIIGNPVTRGVHLELESFISTFGGSYEVLDDGRNELRALAGARYLYVGTTTTFAVGRPGGGRSRTSVANGVTWDGIVGLQGRRRLADDLWITYYGDVGLGGSDLTWKADLGFEFNPGAVGLIGGVRYMHWDLDSRSALKTLSAWGPYLGAVTRF